MVILETRLPVFEARMVCRIIASSDTFSTSGSMLHSTWLSDRAAQNQRITTKDGLNLAELLKAAWNYARLIQGHARSN